MTHLETCDCCYQRAVRGDMSIFELRKKLEELRDQHKEIVRKVDSAEKRIETINHLLKFLDKDDPKEWR